MHEIINLRPYLSFFTKEILKIIFSYTSRQSSHIKVISWISTIWAPVHDKELNISTAPVPYLCRIAKLELKTNHCLMQTNMI